VEMREVLEELLLLEGMPGERDGGGGRGGDYGRGLGEGFFGREEKRE
jgi:hypothetical protein